MNEKYKTSLDKKILMKELYLNVLQWWKFLLGKWLIILTFGLIGGIIGLTVSLLIKPKYIAHLSFSLVEKSGGGGGLADLASSFGFGGLIGGNSDVFSGDNLLEIIQSRYAIEQTLLTSSEYNGNKRNMVEIYIDFNKLRKKWINDKKHPELGTLHYPIGQKRETFSRTQDSVLFEIYSEIKENKALNVIRKNKKINIVDVYFTSKDEEFSKLFVKTLMDVTYRFYSETRTSQSRANINMMKHTADSIKDLYESALFKSAGFSQANLNPALQLGAVPRIKQENNAQLYGAVYAEVLKNLETLKLDLARETPLVQIIDIPRLPLEKIKFGKVKGIVIGGILGGLLIISILVGKKSLVEIIDK